MYRITTISKFCYSFQMVRNYKRKREKAYTRENLLEAVKLVKQKKINSYVAAERFNIPRSTIISHVYATRGQKQINPGKDTVFSKSFEQEISSFLKIMEKKWISLDYKRSQVIGIRVHQKEWHNYAI